MELRHGKHRRPLALVMVALALAAGLSSCASRLGWGLVLWSSADARLPAGSVVPVYIKSNISHVYVVGSLDGRSKVELPLWQVELYKTKGKAKAAAAKFAPYASLYLIAARDGLPVRETPTNAADNRVFRLREGQSVKVLDLAKGEVVRSGDTPLAGDWYYVLTDDGTRGYVFSNTMRLFDESKDSGAAPSLAASSTSAVKIDVFFTRQWRPAYFQEMNDSGRPDLDVFNPRFGIFIDAIRRQIRLELPAASQVFTYNSITEDNGSFVFEGSPLKVRFLNERHLVADWTGESFGQAVSDTSSTVQAGAPVAASPSPAAAGTASGTSSPAPGSGNANASAGTAAPQTQAYSSSMGSTGRADFVILSFDIRDVIHTEELRRQRLLDAFLAAGSDWSLLLVPGSTLSAEGSAAGGEPALAAPSTVAQPSASRLQATSDGRFRWSGTELVPPGYLPFGLPASADGNSGDLSCRLYLPQSLQSQWTGVLSLRFDAQDGSEWTNFLWRADGDGLLLLPVDGLPSQDAGSPSPLSPLRFARAH